jgi:uncharacterized protein
MDISKQIAQELGIKETQVINTINLLDEGNTIPFIARYRKEMTGELDELTIRKLSERLSYLRNLENRKDEIIRLIEEQEKLTPELTEQIKQATTLQELEDLYRPFRPKRRTRASIAKEKGLEPLAETLLTQENDLDLERLSEQYLNEKVSTIEVAKQGALDILAEKFADDPAIRQAVRQLCFDKGYMVSEQKASEDKEDIAKEFTMYFEFREAVKKIPPHRILAINRGEKLDVLKVKIDVDPELCISAMERMIISNSNSPAISWILEAIKDGFQRLLFPSIEREIRNALTEKAEEHAINIFGKNLHSLLMQPPVRGKKVLGIDPAYRTGCKIVAVNAYGDLLKTGTIYPHEPQNNWDESIAVLQSWVDEFNIDLIVIGNGTASRESELLVADLIKNNPSLQYLVINEAGASVYSASDIAREEFPELDVSIRGAISIARRVQDPLAELVKIDPKSIGVGLYQHDVNQKALSTTLGEVVESCVNYVGVELNSASVPLLRYVAGLSASVAKEVVNYRRQNRVFKTREELKKVRGLGPKAFEQCAGFLRIAGGENPLDNTAVHPESYELAEEVLNLAGFTVDELQNPEKLEAIKEKLKILDPKELASKLEAGEPTIRDILASLAQPGRDPRDELPPPIFRVDVMKIEDLKPGMVLKGTVQNVVDFGAFVDIGVKRSGLVHISQISDEFIKHPTDVLQVGDIVDVQVLDVDLQTERISLTMRF